MHYVVLYCCCQLLFRVHYTVNLLTVAAWHLPIGPVCPASRWAATSNVEVGQTTYPINRGSVEREIKDTKRSRGKDEVEWGGRLRGPQLNGKAALKCLDIIHPGVNHAGMGMHPLHLNWGNGYITIPLKRMVNWTAVRPQDNQIAPAYSEPIGLVTAVNTSSSFTSISKISISLGKGSSTRPRIGSPPLGLRPWTPMGDFRPQDMFPFASINPPKVTEPLTPLYICTPEFL